MTKGFRTERDRVAVYYGDAEVTFPFLIKDVSPSLPSRLTSAPIENGGTRFDGKVVDPGKVTLNCICTKAAYAKTIKSIMKMRNNTRAEFYAVKTRIARYKNLALQEVSFKEDGKYLDAVEFTLTFQQVFIQGRAGSSPRSEEDQSTVAYG